jgi:hypothetical protein
MSAFVLGAKVSEKTLLFDNSARLGETRFETWLTHFRSTKGGVKISCAAEQKLVRHYA